MPEFLIQYITQLPDEQLFQVLDWIQHNPAHAIEELEAVVSRQQPCRFGQRKTGKNWKENPS